MSAAPNEDRLEAVAALLDREGIPYEGVSVAGADDDVAVVKTRDVDADRMAAIAKRIRALGFRYVTIDLESVAGEAA